MRIVCAYDNEDTFAMLHGITDVSLYYVNGDKKERARAKLLMKHWGAQEYPFAVAFEGNVPVYFFYSECSYTLEEDIISYLQEEQTKYIPILIK